MSQLLCEVKGGLGDAKGTVSVTVALLLRQLCGLMVRTPDAHASEREFKSQWNLNFTSFSSPVPPTT